MEHSRSRISIQDPTCRGLSSRMDALRIEPYGFEVVFSMHEAECRLRRIYLLRTSVNKGKKEGCPFLSGAASRCLTAISTSLLSDEQGIFGFGGKDV